MKHYSRPETRQSRPLIAVFLCVCLWLICMIVPANAASKRPTSIHKIPFNTAQDDTARLVDWRSPSTTLIFNMPDNDWVDDVELLLSARPIGTVHPSSPLLVRFNDAAPVPIRTQGAGFDARITLDRLRIRKDRNQISFEYQVPSGQACLGPNHGAWDIDTAASFVVVKSRSKSQDMTFKDFKRRLAARSTAPNTVTLLSAGPNAVKLKALAAQGLARNVDTIPNFTHARSGANIEIVAARRDQLSKWVNKTIITKSTGPQIAIGRSRPVQLVLTGDTDEQVMDAAKAFSSFIIPSSQSRDLSPTRFVSTGLAIEETRTLFGKVDLFRLNAKQFSGDWAPKPQHIHFDIADPGASYGSLSLQLRSGPFVDPSSTLSATLNGKSLGKIALTKSKMKAKIDIPRGVLRGLNNKLTLTPTLIPSSAQPICAAANIGPGFSLGTKSALTIRADYQSDATDLSRFMASGLPFGANEGAGSHVILSTRNRTEEYAAYKLIAQLGRASKSGWGHANIIGSNAKALPATGHVLLIGSRLTQKHDLLAGAPKGLKVAMGGSVHQDPITRKSASSSVPEGTMLSARQSLSGGVAALYRDHQNPARIIGVLTQTKGQSFSRAVDNLLSGDHWSRLEGSVARWNKDSVAMAQTAIAPTLKAPSKPKLIDTLSLPDMALPELSLPDMSGVMKSAESFWDDLVSGTKGLFETSSKPAQSPLIMPDSFVPQTHSARPQARRAAPRGTVDIPSLRNAATAVHPANTFGKLPETAKSKVRDVKKTLSAPIKPAPVSKPRNAYPQTDIKPALKKEISQVGNGLSAVYERSAQSLTAKIERSGLGAHRPADNTGVQILPFALLGIMLLLIAVFIKPSKP